MKRISFFLIGFIVVSLSARMVSGQAWENRNALKLILPSNATDPSKTLTILAPSITGTSFVWTLPDGNSVGILKNDGLGNLSWVNGIVNPMTTLGDMVYGGASGAATRLTGQTTIARGFLSQTETGGTAAAPAWFDLFGTANSWSATQTISSGNMNVTSGTYKIGGSDVLSSTTLGSGVTGSSLTSVGTIGTGVWQATKIAEAYGGTNQTTYTTGDLLYASGSNTLSKLGIGATDKALVVSSGLPSWQSIVNSAIGTSNQVNVSGATGAVTFSLPQNIHTSATPQFARIGLGQAADGTASFAATQDALGATSTDGLVLQNTTAATAGVQQYSPRLRLTGQGWKINTTAASRTTDWIMENQTSGAGVNPNSSLVFSNQVDGGGYNRTLTLTNGIELPSMTVKLASGQLTHLQDWTNSSGTVLSYVDKDGNFFPHGLTLTGDLNITGSYLINSTPVLQTNAGPPDNFIIGYGSRSLSSVTGSQNTLIGDAVGVAITSATNNVMIGTGAGTLAVSDTNNTFVGTNAGFRSTSDQNTFIGAYGGYSTTTGDSNTFVGSNAGYTNSTGKNNTALGYLADVASNNLSNAMALGYGASVNASNKIQLGNTSVTLVNTSGAINTGTGFQISGAATSGNYLRGNGTNFVAATIQANDLPTVDIAHGGTNGTASPTAGGVAYGDGTSYAFTTAGSSGQILKSNGAGAPTFTSSVSGLTITNSSIGSSNPGTGAFTTLSSTGATTLATGNNLTNTFGTGTAAANTIGVTGGTNILNGHTTINDQLDINAAFSASNIGISGGTIDGTPIGSSVASTGAFHSATSAAALTATSDGANAVNTGLSLSASGGTSNIALDITSGNAQIAGNLATTSGGTITSDGTLTASNGFTLSAGTAAFGSRSVTGSNFSITGGTITGTPISASTGAFTSSTSSTPLTATANGTSLSSGVTGLSVTNSATSSNSSLSKVGLSIASTGSWNGTSSTNRGLTLSVTGGTTNTDILGTSSTWNVTSAGAISAVTYSGSGDITTTAGNLVAGTTSNPGKLKLTNTGGFTATVDATNLTAAHAISFPNADGNLALVSSLTGGIAQADVSGLTTGSSPQFTALTLTSTTNQLVLGTTRTATISAVTPATTSRVYTISDPGAAAFIGITSSTPVDNKVPLWNSTAGLMDNSSITDDGTTVTTTENLSALKGTFTNTTNQLVLGTTRTATISAVTPATTSRVYTISDPGAAAFIGITSSTPVDNTVPLWNSTDGRMDNSSITDNGTTVATTENFSALKGTFTNTTNQLVLGTTNTTTLTAAAPGASRTYTIPDVGGAATFSLTTSTPTTNVLPKWSGTAGNMANSSITDNGTTVSTTLPIASTATSNQLVLGTTNTTTISATAPSTGRVYTLPDAAANANISLITGTVNTGGVIYNSSATAQASSAAGTAGQILESGGSGAPTWGISPTGIYGDGSDGDVTISTNTSLTRDMYYHDLTINSNANLTPVGFRIYCTGTLTVGSGCSINRDGNPGNTTATGTGGAGGLATTNTGPLGGGTAGGAGGTNSAAGGVVPTGPTTSGGGNGATGGTNTGGTSRAGGTGATATAPVAAFGGIKAAHSFTAASTGILIQPGGNPTALTGGAGGGGGGGTNTPANKGGGGGGGGGGVLLINAWKISNSGTISANGGAGGSAPNGTAGVGGGGGGGVVLIITHSDVTSLGGTITAAGGANGTTGNTTNVGTAGDGPVVLIQN